jgi:alpha-methylacyl-CoA racemase
MNPSRSAALRPLKGQRVTSLALNMPGPAALMRCRQMGARCVKVEPPPPHGAPAGARGDAMSQHSRAAYDEMHQGVRVVSADLKGAKGQAAVHRVLARTDVLLTSFRPSALEKLGLGWTALHRRYPSLSQVAIVGSPGAGAAIPGHDLTYLAEHGLVPGLDLPPTLYADMGGALMASEAILQAALLRQSGGKGVFIEVALAEAARWLAAPRRWGLTLPHGMVGGAHAGYRVYPCKDGRVAVAALEPHFAAALCCAAGLAASGLRTMLDPHTQPLLAAFFASRTRAQLDRLALEKDLPVHTLT